VTQTMGQTAGITVVADGVPQSTAAVTLVDDQEDHVVEVRITLPPRLERPRTDAATEPADSSGLPV